MKVETLKMQHSKSLGYSSASFVGFGFVLLFFTLFLESCSFSSETEVQLSPFTAQVMVECYLEKGQPVRALVTETQSFLAPPSLPDVNDAIITLTDDAGKEYLLRYTPERVGTKFFNYSLGDTIAWRVGAQYNLKVLRGGKELTARTRILSNPVIQGVRDIKNSESFHQLQFHLGRNTAPQWFRVLFNVNELNSPLALVYLFGNNTRTNPSTGNVEIQTPFRFRSRERVLVRAFNLNEDYFLFLESVELAKQSAGNPFAQPAQIVSNIEGGVGIFTTLQADSVWVNLPQ